MYLGVAGLELLEVTCCGGEVLSIGPDGGGGGGAGRAGGT